MIIYKGEAFKVIATEHWKVPAAAEEGVRVQGGKSTLWDRDSLCSPKTET